MPESAPPLSDGSLAGYAGTLRVPGYDRTTLVPSIVHIGVGGFHRAHQAVYLDDLAGQGETGWGVVGVGLHRPQMGEVLSAQDCLFTVVERGPGHESARVVGSLVDYLYAPEDPEAVLRVLADPRTRIVTLTITGAGYLIDDAGAFQEDDAEVQRDLASPSRPCTVTGYLTAALDRRRRAGNAPFTVLSCDNLPDSGAAARTAVVAHAALRDPALASWIEANVTFPSGMVDRITPETSPHMRDVIERTVGIADRWPVVTEPFSQWVVEDDFCNGRPPLERVGVQFVDDVGPHKLIKARMLNGGHCALGYLGALAGHTRTDEAMADPVVRAVVARMLGEEVQPLMPRVPGVDLTDYRRTTLQRFANPAIGDTLARLCRRGSVKMPSYLLTSLREAREQGRPSSMLLLAVAAWLLYLRGADLAGRPIEVVDPRAEELCRLARAGGDDPRLVLGLRSVFGSLEDDPRLVDELGDVLRVLSRHGLEAAVGACGSTVRTVAA
ncbi:mannitol dehydrogenase family protein [Modestobacter altitudinis]|uniref:mannitol dehydrogenase family protein n=1 Tax=Modestobacter altitudinis TaxID=2213158 RepID=UPI00110CEC2A|nr:mannitol dehydrogenase family protein [Modestobacter altitudinis]